MSEDTSRARRLKVGSSEANNPSKAGYSEVIRTSEVGGPRVDPTSEAHPNIEDSKEAQDGSSDVSQYKKTMKYKCSHSEELILGYKDSPIKKRSAIIEEHSMLGLLPMTETTSVGEAPSDDGWIVAMQEELDQFQRNDV